MHLLVPLSGVKAQGRKDETQKGGLNKINEH